MKNQAGRPEIAAHVMAPVTLDVNRDLRLSRPIRPIITAKSAPRIRPATISPSTYESMRQQGGNVRGTVSLQSLGSGVALSHGRKGQVQERIGPRLHSQSDPAQSEQEVSGFAQPQASAVVCCVKIDGLLLHEEPHSVRQAEGLYGDGMTLLQRSGEEGSRCIRAIDLDRREGVEKLWRQEATGNQGPAQPLSSIYEAILFTARATHEP
jgi:hypothetical protein